MKRMVKRSGTILLVLVLIFAMTAMSVSAFTPPGLARKLQATEQEQVRHQWRIFNGDGLAQFFRLMPEGIGGKFIPPGLLDKGGLPPGIQKVFGDKPENWPPGIRMRFGDAIDWDEEKETDELRVTDVSSYRELTRALLNRRVEVIQIEDDIIVTGPLVINRPVTIRSKGNNEYMLEAAEGFEGWMIEVRSNGRLSMYDLKLDGFEADKDDFEGLVKVAKGGTLTAEDNMLQYAPVGFGLLVDEYNEGDEDQLMNDNEFEFIEEEVVFYDADNVSVILYPEE